MIDFFLKLSLHYGLLQNCKASQRKRNSCDVAHLEEAVRYFTGYQMLFSESYSVIKFWE